MVTVLASLAMLVGCLKAKAVTHSAQVNLLTPASASMASHALALGIGWLGQARFALSLPRSGNFPELAGFWDNFS